MLRQVPCFALFEDDGVTVLASPVELPAFAPRHACSRMRSRALLINPPVFDRIFRRLSLSDWACFWTYERLKKRHGDFHGNDGVCKLLKNWLLR